MYKAWRSLTFWSVNILSINPFFSLFMGASDHTFSQDVINLTVASIQIISKIIGIQGCGTRISIWSLLIFSVWPVSVYVLYSIQQQKPQKRPVIFHSQGHSSSTESDLSSLIPVEIPAPVLEVFEVSANEVGAIYNSPNLQQFLMKNSQFWKHLCHTNYSSDLNFRPARLREDNLSFLPSLPHVRCCIPRQFHIFTFRKKRNLSHNINWKFSNNCTTLLLIKFLCPNDFCSAGIQRLSAHSAKHYVKSYSFSCIHSYHGPLQHSKLWNTVICLEAWVLNFCMLVSSPPM